MSGCNFAARFLLGGIKGFNGIKGVNGINGFNGLKGAD